MPIALSTSKTFDIVLDIDADAEPRPAFVCRYLTTAEIAELQRETHEAAVLDGRLDVIARMESLLKGKITGWRNMIKDGKELPFGPLSSVCSEPELFEIVDKAWRLSELSEVDLKKSMLRLSSATANSAPTANPPVNVSMIQPAVPNSGGSVNAGESPIAPSATEPAKSA